MEWSLELVLVPVSDVERARAFYRDAVGFVEDFETRFSDTVRMVQLTPPGSACSIGLLEGLVPGPGMRALEPGSMSGLHLVVPDLTAARDRLIQHGVEVSEVMEVVHEEGRSRYVPVTGPFEGWNAYAFFSDPDGKCWILQERPPQR